MTTLRLLFIRFLQGKERSDGRVQSAQVEQVTGAHLKDDYWDTGCIGFLDIDILFMKEHG